MKKIAIVDILSLSYGDKIYGHFAKTSYQFYEIFKKEYSVVILGGKNYINYDMPLRLLPFSVKRDVFYSSSLLKKVLVKIYSFINMLYVLCTNYDIYIFHDNNRNVLNLFVWLFNKRKRIFIIRYTANRSSNLKNIYYSGVISSNEKVAKSYNMPYLIVPDYFPMQEKCTSIIAKSYDVCCLGTVIEGKDYEDVIESFSYTNINVLIAGSFKDKKRLHRLKKAKTDNITIIDKYITDKEYYEYIRSSRYLALPYKASVYENKSSGVVLDAIYEETPVIAHRISGFEWIEKENVGILYNDSLKEILEYIKDINNDKLFKSKILDFIQKMKCAKNNLLTFVS